MEVGFRCQALKHRLKPIPAFPFGVTDYELNDELYIEYPPKQEYLLATVA
jgi:hypothetical protein